MKIKDVDGNEEDRSGTISVFNGAKPIIEVCDNVSQERERVAEWLLELAESGVKPQEIGIFVRSDDEIARANQIAELAGLHARVLDDKAMKTGGSVTISTMHLAKGLEFRYVAVVACDDEVIPSQIRIEEITDQPIWRRCTTQNGIFFMWRAQEHATLSLFPAWTRSQSF